MQSTPGTARYTFIESIAVLAGYHTPRDLRKLDIGLDNVSELAADRVLWRGLVRYAPLWCMLLMMMTMHGLAIHGWTTGQTKKSTVIILNLAVEQNVGLLTMI